MPIEEKPGAKSLDPKKKDRPYEDNRFAPHPDQMKPDEAKNPGDKRQ